jgi:aminopeptidase N
VKIALYDSQGKLLPIDNDVLELKEQSQTFYFDNIQQMPLISLLRDFSAPVSLHYQRREEELIALMRFETDGFAKWNAAQDLTVNCLSKQYYTDKAKWVVPAPILDAYQHILADDNIDSALRAEILTPPSFDELANHLNEIDVTLLESVRDFYRQKLSNTLFDKAQAIYQLLWSKEDNAMNGDAYSRRKLRNICLWLMMKADEKSSKDICYQQFTQAGTMTDQIASLNLLVNCKDEPLRTKAIAEFYKQWQKDDLVLDKWFSAQALSELPGTLTKVKELMSHPAFDFKNPNKFRSLIGVFCFANHRHFHALDGSGYQFLSDILLQMDKYNPQISARMATPFTRWQRLDKTRQKLMQEQLNILSAQDLSSDLSEMISKSMS